MIRIVAVLIFVCMFQIAYAEPCEINVAINDTLRPHEYINSEGNLSGFTVALSNEIAKRLGCDIKYTMSTWKEKQELLNTNQVDMVSFVNTDNYCNDCYQVPIHGLVYFMQVTTYDVANPNDIILLNDNAFIEAKAKEMFPNSIIKKYNTEKETLNALFAGEGTSAILSNNYAIHGTTLAEKNKIKVLDIAPIHSNLGLAISKRNPKLASDIISVIDTFKNDGTYVAIITNTQGRREIQPFYKIIIALLLTGAVVTTSFLVWTRLLRHAVAQKTKQLSHEVDKHKQTQNWLATILDSVPECLCMFDKQMNLVWTNIDENKSMLSVDDIKNKTKIEMQAMLISGKPFNKTVVFDDESTWEFKGIVVHNEFMETELLIVANDMTDVVALREEALMTSKLATLGEIAMGIAHEINNPVGIIQLNMTALKQDLNNIDNLNNDEINTSIIRVEDSVARIRKIVDDMKHHGRKQSSEYAILSLENALNVAISLCGQMIKKVTDHFLVDVAKDCPAIYGDKLQLEHAILNVLQNACSALKSKHDAIKCKLYYDENSVFLEIYDEGMGILPENLAKVRSPFFTTRQNVGGTGLGLSIVSRIIKEHNGKLLIASEPEKWTKITLEFPIYKTQGDV